MNCLAFSDLSREQRDAIARVQVLRMQRAVREVLSTLPAMAPDLPPACVTPDVAVAGNPSMEPNA